MLGHSLRNTLVITLTFLCCCVWEKIECLLIVIEVIYLSELVINLSDLI